MDRYKVRYTATKIKYSTTRIKSRNFLSNISYTGINKNDFYNESFIVDVYVLLVKNLNPISMSRKLTDKNKHEMVYIFWRECIPSEFYRNICEGSNFIYLNGKMSVSLACAISLPTSSIRASRTFACCKKTSLATKTSSSTFILTFFLRCTRQPRNEASISRATFT